MYGCDNERCRFCSDGFFKRFLAAMVLSGFARIVLLTAYHTHKSVPAILHGSVLLSITSKTKQTR